MEDAEDAGLMPGSEDPMEKEAAIHSSILAWTDEPGGLQCRGIQRVGHD